MSRVVGAGIKKTFPASAFILALLFSTVAGTWLFGSVAANPHPVYDERQVTPDSETYPPTISISSPENDTAYAANRISLIFNVTAPESKTAYDTWISQISYDADWKEKPVVIYHPETNQLANLSFEFYGLPEGKHSILIQASGGGWYAKYGNISTISSIMPVRFWFYITSSSLINFTIDTTAPTVSVLSMENKTYASPDVPLNFAVNESVSQITYSLDGQENVTVAGNTTLTDLPDGEHNITVYAHDPAGNIGASETVTFTVAKEPEAFPTAIVATASAASIATVSAALLIYFKKRKH